MKALDLIKENDVIYIDHATVGYFMAKNLPSLKMTAVTNSIIVAEELRQKEKLRIILIGGDMNQAGVCKSALAIEMIQRLRFDISFVTSACLSASFGLSIQTAESVGLINAIINSSKRVIGLYPTEKIGFDSIVQICPANKLDALITDWDAPEEELKKFDDIGIEVIVVDKD
jgi:DeoR family transcriptional regulator, fructose operon transcriptional repressor